MTNLEARHLRIGWWGLAVFILLGAVLETMHALKTPTYVDAGRETARLLLRLAHAHGTLISIVNILYAPHASKAPAASPMLAAALVLLPGGFFLGGLWARGGDPGLGVILVPVGAILLLVGSVLVARSHSR